QHRFTRGRNKQSGRATLHVDPVNFEIPGLRLHSRWNKERQGENQESQHERIFLHRDRSGKTKRDPVFGSHRVRYCVVCTDSYMYSMDRTECPATMMLLDESMRTGSQTPSTFLYRRSISVLSVQMDGRFAGEP